MSNKIIITLSICLAFALSSNAQNQLTFNQVLLVPLTAQGDTVPQGKVWKVESAAITAGTNIVFYVDGMHNYILWGSTSSNNTHMTNFNSAFPMWLPAGTIVTHGNGVNALSIIEFNIE